MVRTAPTVREGVRSRRRYLTTTAPDAGHAHQNGVLVVVDDGDHLVTGLADRLGGTVQYSSPQAKLALIASVYSERDLPIDRVTEVLRPYAGALRIDEEAAETYTLDGSETPFLVFYRSPRLYFKENGPPAAGAMRSRPLCHWDLHAAYGPEDAGREVCLKVGSAALALAGESGGIALDVLGFIISLSLIHI